MTETDQLVGHVSVGGPSTSSSSPPVPRAATHHLLARTAGCPPAEWSWPTAWWHCPASRLPSLTSGPVEV